MAIAALAVVLGVVMFSLLYSEREQAGRRQSREDLLADFRGLGRDVDPASAWVGRSEARLESLSRDNAALRRELERLQEALLQEDEPVSPPSPEPPAAPVFEAMPPPAVPRLPFPPPEPPSAPAITPALPVHVEPEPSPEPPGALAMEPDTGVLVVEIAVAPAVQTDAGNGPHDLGTYLPAGSFARAALLTGLDAPTGGVAQTNPVPVLLSLIDGGRLPNRLRHRVQECFVTAAGYGDLAAERAYLRLERLSCVIRAGQVLDLELSGYVVGEDGKAGLRGKPVSKQGALIARALLAGLAGGIGEGLSQSLTTFSTSALGSVSTIDSGEIAQYGLARGAGSAMQQLARWYLERADELYPIIEIGSGRKVEVVLTRGLHLPLDLFGSG